MIDLRNKKPNADRYNINIKSNELLHTCPVHDFDHGDAITLSSPGGPLQKCGRDWSGIGPQLRPDQRIHQKELGCPGWLWKALN